MSKIQVNEIVNHFDNGAPDCPRGLTVTGVSTFSGNVSIGGTLTYEDVTNIDSVGIITARDGLDTPTDLVLRTGGTERLRVTSAGITSITGSLEVNGNNYPTAGALSNRNLIINGAMQVAQRGTSSTANGYVSLDRWFVNQSGGSTTFSQETFTVGEERSGLQNYAKFAVSTSSDFTHIRQLIEDVKSIPAGSVTVSFDAKGTSPSGGLAVSLGQNFGSGGSTAVDIAPQTVTLTGSWQRFSITFTVPSMSGKTVGDSSFFQVVIGQYSDTSTTAWELDITGVQLELGTRATPFEHRRYSEELTLCQRYYQRLSLTTYTGFPLILRKSGTGDGEGAYKLSPPMRTTPSGGFFDTGVINGWKIYTPTNDTTANVTSIVLTQQNQNDYLTDTMSADYVQFQLGGMSGGTAAIGILLFTGGTQDNQYYFDSEL